LDVDTNVTDGTGVTGGKGDVTSTSPSSTPRVLDLPVTRVILTGKENGVVDVGTTVSEDTTGIERPVGSINTDGNGHLGEGLGKSVTVTSGDGNVSTVLEGTLVDLTSLVSGSITILTLLNETVVLNVLEGT